MSKEKILIVDDDEDIRELVRYNLAKEGYQLFVAATGEEGLKAAHTHRPDLIVLDLMLPGLDGLEVCRRLKASAETHAMPIIMLTAKREESDVVVGLELGAEDYMSKPFSAKVLLARIRTVLRRKHVVADNEQAILRVHDLTIHPGRNEVLVKNTAVDLTATEYRILYFMARRPGWVFTRQQIVSAGRGENSIVSDRAVDVQIVGLRKKLGSAGKYIETVRGIGYRFKE